MRLNGKNVDGRNLIVNEARPRGRTSSPAAISEAALGCDSDAISMAAKAAAIASAGSCNRNYECEGHLEKDALCFPDLLRRRASRGVEPDRA